MVFGEAVRAADLIALTFVVVGIITCSAGPVFQSSGDHEEGADIPCMVGGHVNPGWHACHRRLDRCCPNGTSCGDDDFVPRPGVCRSW
jgi:hypothetical protein